MERRTFLLQAGPGCSPSDSELAELFDRVTGDPGFAAARDFSVWRAEDMIFGYYETDETAYPDRAGQVVREAVLSALAGKAILISSPGNMRLMFTSIWQPKENKEGLFHRVFMTRLKPGCATEYKDRHDGLVAQMDDSDIPAEGRESSNFTIWNAGDYICGYNEMEKPAVTDSDENAPWEIRMLEIMDWLTNDVDRISKEKHEAVRCVFMKL